LEAKKVLCRLVDEGVKSGDIVFKRSKGKHRVYGMFGDLETFTLPGNANNRNQTWQNCLAQFHRMYNRAKTTYMEAQRTVNAAIAINPKPKYPYTFTLRTAEPELPLAFTSKPAVYVSVAPIEVFIPEVEKETPVSEMLEVVIPSVHTLNTHTGTPGPSVLSPLLTPKSPLVIHALTILDHRVSELRMKIDGIDEERTSLASQKEEALASIAKLEENKTWVSMAPEGFEAIIESMVTPNVAEKAVASVPTKLFVKQIDTPLKQRLMGVLESKCPKTSTQIQELLVKKEGFETKRTTILSSLDGLRKEGKVMRSEIRSFGAYSYWLV
jgi:hypothetical protein